MISRFKYEYLLVFIAIIWALFFSHVIQLKAGFSIYGDDGSYLAAAKKLYWSGKADETRPLLIAAINGFPFLFGFSEAIVIRWSILINFLCWISTSIIIFKIGSTYLKPYTAFLYALLFVFCIGNLAIAFNMLSESVFVFFLMLALYWINRFSITSNDGYITWAISLLIVTLLVRPISIGLVILLVIFYAKHWKGILFNRYSILILVSLMLVLFQMNSVKKNSGDYTISYIDSFTYYNYLGAKADCLQKNIDFLPGKNERFDYFATFSNHEQRQIANQDIKNQIQNNTFNLLKAYLFCIYSNSSKGSYIVSSCKNEKQSSYFKPFYFSFKAISKIQNILFTIVGVLTSLFFLIKFKRHTTFNLYLSIVILYLFGMSAISCFQADRFHLVFYPLIIVLMSNFSKKKVIF